jgi:hypothetical protein
MPLSEAYQGYEHSFPDFAIRSLDKLCLHITQVILRSLQQSASRKILRRKKQKALLWMT